MICVIVVEPSVAGNSCRQIPFASAVATIGVRLSIVTVTVLPASANPHTVACCGARCKTMLDPSVRDRKFLRGSGGGTNGVFEGGHGHPGGNFAPQSGHVELSVVQVLFGLQYSRGGGNRV